MLILNYTNKESTYLVYPCLLGMKISNMIVTIPRKNVEISWKPMVDYDLCLALLPNMLCGVSIGVLLNMILANLYLVIIFASFTSYAFYMTIKKSIIFFKEEMKKNREDA
jgi:uncharacterized membrane protein YfcA